MNTINYLMLLSAPESQASAAQTAIDGFAHLGDGWHYGSGIAPDKATRDRASAALERMQILGLGNVQAFSGIDGEILLVATRRGDYFSATIERSGLYTFNHERGGEEIEYQEGLSRTEFIGNLLKAIGGVWHTSGSLIHDGLITTDLNSTTWLSRSLRTVECQLLNLNAPSQLVA